MKRERVPYLNRKFILVTVEDDSPGCLLAWEKGIEVIERMMADEEARCKQRDESAEGRAA